MVVVAGWLGKCVLEVVNLPIYFVYYNRRSKIRSLVAVINPITNILVRGDARILVR